MGHRLCKALGPSGLDSYPIALDNIIKLAKVRRDWMSVNYGGSSQGSRPDISTDRFQHGIKDWCYLTYDYNPNAPQHPGAPGLKFGCPGEDLESKRDRIMMCTDSPFWLYMGFYVYTPSTPLTRDEWCARPSKVSSSPPQCHFSPQTITCFYSVP